MRRKPNQLAGPAYCSHCSKSFVRKTSEKFCSLKCAVISRADIQSDSECWNWNSPVGSHGYGAFAFRGAQYTSHRASYLAHKGAIPRRSGNHGGVVMHSCDNRLCVNPEHLSVGSQAENLADAFEKGRMRAPVAPFGITPTNAKLVESEVLRIKELIKSGHSGRQIAKQFNVSENNISAIKTGRSWKGI